MKKANQVLYSIFVFGIFSSCIFSCKDKPSDDQLKECLANELSNKALIESFEQQDGLTREKDGVKYYEGYFNAEIKFVSNSSTFNAGDRYKIIKGTVSFMKTEKGWNCQRFDMPVSNLVKIKEQGESSEHIDSKEEEVLPPQSTPQNDFSKRTPSIAGVYPQASERLLSVSDVSGLSKWQLKIMRNEIFARRGYIFKTADMQQYFNAESWYKPIYDDVSNALTNIEKANIEFIKKFE